MIRLTGSIKVTCDNALEAEGVQSKLTAGASPDISSWVRQDLEFTVNISAVLNTPAQ